MKNKNQKIYADKQPFKYVILLIFCIGLTISVSFFIFLQRQEQKQINADFTYQVQTVISSFEETIQDHLLLMKSLNGLFKASDVVTRLEFKQFVEPLIQHYPSIQALEWIPRVLDAERAMHEDFGRQELANYQITEKTAQGQVERAKQRLEYYPVYFIEPLTGNEKALGYDLASQSTRLAALTLARDNNRLTATSPVSLVQEREEQFGFLAFSPVYIKGQPVETTTARRENIAGFTLGVFRIGDIIKESLKLLDISGIDISVFDHDVSVDSEKKLLYFHSSRSRDIQIAPIQYLTKLQSDAHSTSILKVLEKNWLIICTPTPTFIASKKTLLPWSVSGALLLLTIGIGGYIWLLKNNALRLSRYNAEILLSKTHLEKEISERHLTEKKLQISEKRSRTWLEYSPVCTKIVDLDFNLQYMSSAGIKGLQIEDITPFYGKPFPFVFYPDSFKAPMTRDLEKVKTTGQVIEQEAPVVDINGNELWFHSTLVPVNDDKGKIDYIIIVSIDTTNRKNAEREKENLENRLGQAQKMEAIGTLAGGIAHDFNNILGTILGYAEMAKEDASPGTQIEEYLDKVLIAANRAKDLVKQILAFSRQSQVERIPIKIQPLIKEGLKMLRSSIPTTISITEDIDPKSGITLADPTQVHQILMNLCTNAYQTMETTGGELSVTLKTSFIGPEEQKMFLNVTPGEYIEFTVSDTGSGIEPDLIGKIFDPYFTTKGIGKGTGMGLAIIHGIMKEYGGTITVESELGKGSTFHVYFPIVEKKSLPEIKEPENLPRGTERILFIDDEELLAEMGKDMLERLGYHVTVRHSSIEALTTFQNTPNDFDIVITDQTMPDMIGSDLARRMMQIRPDIPIILCTGYSNLIDENSAKGLGIKEFALKPLTKGTISKLVRKVLDEK